MEKTQSFRLIGTTVIENIPIVHLGEQDIVNWQDITQVFGRVQYVRNGNVTVNMMKDSNRRIIDPPCINHFPGAVLDVVLSTTLEHDPVDRPMATSSLAPANGRADTPTHDPIGCSGAINNELDVNPPSSSILTISESVSGLSITPNLSTELSPAEPRQPTLTRRTTTHMENQLKSVTEAIDLAHKSGKPLDREALTSLINSKLIPAATTPVVVAAADESHFRRYMVEKVNGLTVTVAVIENKVVEVLQNQQRMLDCLALILQKAEAILVQNYELLEYTIPRLFVVLPDASTSWDPVNKIRTKFRLHFICECGEHTKAFGSKIPHHLHLANHEGYVVNKPSDFFKKYGPFLMVMLQLIKVGTGIAGHAVPALASLKVVNAIDFAQSTIDSVTSKIIDGVDFSLACLEENRALLEKSGNIDVEGNVRRPQEDFAGYLAGVEGLEGMDLRQLGSYLAANSSDNLLGNLFRMTTKNGHVKWVCRDHYRTGYKEQYASKLREVVKMAGGDFDEQLGKLNIWLKSAIMATEFYDAVSKATGVLDLDVGLGWDQEYSDLVNFKNMILKSNIRSLRINLNWRKSPKTDIILSGSRRYDPIFEIMRHSSMQSFEIERAPKDFFQRSSPLPENVDLSHLRHLRFDAADFSDADIAKLKLLLAMAPNLPNELLPNDSGELPVAFDSIPRLFIILPETSTAWDPTTMFRTKFRLHFICECGEHTKTTEDTIPHDLHLAKHEGYIINKSTTFFETYGTYMLLMLNMIKTGYKIAGLVIPVLANSKTINLLNSTQSAIDSASSKISEDVDYALEYMKEISTPHEPQETNAVDSIGDARVLQDDLTRYLQGAVRLEGKEELRLFVAYLSENSPCTSLGNLYRMTTKDGHVKWVCRDHYRTSYEENHTQKLCEIVKLAGGEFDQQQGRIKIALKSSSEATEFYNVVSKAKDVLELIVDLHWECTWSDIRALEDALKNSRVSILRLDLGRFRTSFGSNILSTSAQYGVLSRLKELPNMKAIDIVLPKELIKLISFQWTTSSQHCTLSLEMTAGSIGGKDIRILAEMLKTSSALITLILGSNKTGDSGAQVLAKALTTNSTLTTLNLESNNIGDDGAQALAEALKTNSTLTTLNLQSNKIGDDGAQALAEALKTNLTLTSLNLQNNKIGDNGVLAIGEACEANSMLTILK
ncbi:hypothetical protein BGZ83_001223 [Gryganskiella cystojenkinii]|nr:hypothetical protein BGZ83_001223 [Gryganskiella cystojenkinii]